MVSSVVATGRAMKGADRFMSAASHRHRRRSADRMQRRVERHAAQAPAQAVEGEVDHRRGEERQHLAHDQAADDGEAERMSAAPSRCRCPASAAGRRPAPPRWSSGSAGSAAGRPDGSPRCGALPSLRSASSAKSIIMMAFFLTMPISSTMPMMATTLRSVPGHHQRQQRADAGRRQGRQDRDGMDVALVEHAQHDVDRDDGGQDQQQLAVERLLEGERGALEVGGDRQRHADLALAPPGWRRPPGRAHSPAPG